MLWASVENKHRGRWRSDPRDEHLSYAVTADEVVIRTTVWTKRFKRPF